MELAEKRDPVGIPQARRKGQPRQESFGRKAYRRRSHIEQVVGWYKECRALGTRYEKFAVNYAPSGWSPEHCPAKEGVPMRRGLRVLVTASILVVCVAFAAVFIWQEVRYGVAPVLGLTLLVLGATGATLYFGAPGADTMRRAWRNWWFPPVLCGAAFLGWLYLDRWVQPEIQFITACNRGAIATAAGDWQAAADAYSEAIGVAPSIHANTAQAHTGRGKAQLHLKNYSQAIDDFTEAIRLDPMAMAYHGRGGAYLHQGELDRAVADFSEAIRLDPNDATAPYNRGLAYFQKKDFDRALTDFGEAIRLKPSFREAYLARSSVYAKKGDDARAKADQKKAAELGPSTAKSNGPK